jgi:pimeloyl-ACP methyl ester carboxylesterase
MVMGAAVSMMLWPQGFLDELCERGFHVARFDNRDAGRSTHLSAMTPPSTARVLRSLGSKRRAPNSVVVPYRLEDMVEDTIAVLDALAWKNAHLVGISMGAAIAQWVCVQHPERVRSLVSISSAPPDFRMARLSLRSIRLMALAARKVKDSDAAAAGAVRLARLTGSPGHPTPEEEIRRGARAEFERAHDPQGGRRQGLAIMASGSRLEALRSIRVPTVVIHGEADVVAPPAGSKLIADAIVGAEMINIPGMGHDLPQALWSRIADDISRLAFASGQGKPMAG